MNLRGAILFVKDVPRMRAFYSEGLGLRVREETATPEWIELETGRAVLALHAIPEHIANSIGIATPPEPRADTPLKLVFETEDFVAARTRLVAHGATMFEPRNPRSCDGLDPEGNVFQIVASP